MTATDEDPFPPVTPHGELEQVFENIWVLTGEISMSMGFAKMCFNRNMVVIRSKNKELVLIHPIRLNEQGLVELDKLGTVKHILRLAGHHGRDDPFYKNRYKTVNVWAVEGTTYFKGLTYGTTPYFLPDEWMNETTLLPIEKADLIVLNGNKPPAEAVLLVERPEGAVLIVGDSLQNQRKDDTYLNWFGWFVMSMMGFLKPYIVGPGWVGSCDVRRGTVERLLELDFDHAIPAHGSVVKENAKEKFRPAIEGMKP